MALDRTTVVETALDLLDEVGLDDLTLRRLADRLGVKAPALYWYVRNKQELLDEMATAMMRTAVPDSAAFSALAWPDLLTTTAHGLRRGLTSRRDGGKLFGGSYLTDDELLAGTEPVLARLVDEGFDLPGAVGVNRAVFCYVLGFVIEEQGTVGREALFAPEARRSRIDESRYPLSAAAGVHMFTDFDLLFARGVRLIVDGAAAALERGQSPEGGRRQASSAGRSE